MEITCRKWRRGSRPAPGRIVSTFSGDPATTISVNWRTSADVTGVKAQIALALPDARFDQLARDVAADSETITLATYNRAGTSIPVDHNEGLPGASYHSVMFEGLEPDTLYAYRVEGADGNWSEWFQTRTAPLSGPIRFVYLGDAQNGIDSHWPRVIRAAFQAAPDARFVLHAGDLVNRGSRDLEWAQWFRAGGFIHGMIPAIPVTGNHEYEQLGLTEEDRQRMLSFMWRPQFRLPVEQTLSPALHETVYEVRYSADLAVFVLNTNEADMTEQARWLDERLTASDARWRVVSMHHPVFSSGRDRDNPQVRDLLLPILLRHNVDLVLQGHDHTYARGSVGGAEGQVPVSTPVTGEAGLATMFVNSVSGAKQYEFSIDGWDDYRQDGVELARRAENTQFFQVIEIDGEALRYAAYTADGEPYDVFEMHKADDGEKRLVPLNQQLPEIRTFDNSLPYSGTGN
jgi:3',5'-cyclic AMP phosphodiesterase CpdA